jgi:outer membrane immunogenic protein
MRIASKSILASVALASATAALADDVSPTPPPTFTLPQPAPPQEPSIWNGLYVGSEMFVVSGKGVKGGAGGAGLIGYDHAFANNLVLGIQASAGYSPALFQQGVVRGFDYASANVKFGYDMGRIMPFVTAGVALARPDVIGRGFTTPTDSINGLFDASTNVRAIGTVGAGVDYAVTDKLTVGVSVSAGPGRALWGQ